MSLRECSPLLQLLPKYPVTNLADEMTLLDAFDVWGSTEVYAMCKSKRGSICTFLTPGKDLVKCVNQGDTWYIEDQAPKAAAAIDGEFLTNYTTFHIMEDTGCLCNKCLSDNASEVLEATRDPGTDTQWEYSVTTINYEDDNLYCDNCNEGIEASYD